MAAALASHMAISKISFTGSTTVGRSILKASADSNMKKVAVEMGGKSPSIILEDADLSLAAKWAAFGIMINQGEVCTAGSRVFVQESVYDSFMKEFLEQIRGMRVGDPLNPGTYYGATGSHSQFERVMGHIEQGTKEGAKLLHGGKKDGEQGYFIQPTVFTDVKPGSSIAQEEIFGPVVVVIKFKTEAEMIAQCNSSIYGLAASIFTRDLTKAARTARAIQAGTIWINSHNMFEPTVPFSGFKQSGLGGCEYGIESLYSYTQTKAIHVNLGSPPPV